MTAQTPAPTPATTGEKAAQTGQAVLRASQAFLRSAAHHAGIALREGARAAHAAATSETAQRLKARAAEGLAEGARLAKDAAVKGGEAVREKVSGYRNEREIDRLARVLDGLSDRDLAVLGLERERLYTELEERFERLDATAAASATADGAATSAEGTGEEPAEAPAAPGAPRASGTA